MATMTDRPLNASVLHREDLNERLAIVRVAPRGWTLPDFEPGQFTTLGLPDPERPGRLLQRVYSIASAPGAGHLEFYIQLVKEGAFTTRLWPLDQGEMLHVSPRIAGTFTLESVPPGRDLLLVATGTGLAPYLSMLRHYRGAGRWRRCAIVHGARTSEELGYRAELEDAARSDGSFRYVPVASREPDGSAWTGLRGHVQALLEGDACSRLAGLPPDPAGCHVFLCGNPAMIDDMEPRLVARGFTPHSRSQPGTLHFERYW